MEFDKSKCYSAVNADELRPGDKVIVAYNMYQLKERVKMFTESVINEIEAIYDDCYCNRFKVKYNENYPLPLAYLVERKSNGVDRICINCKYYAVGCCNKHDKPTGYDKTCRDFLLDVPKTEKHYRPCKNTDELIKVWLEKSGKWQKRELTMPLIWVHRDDTYEECLIVTFDNDSVYLGHRAVSLHELWEHFTFLDGSPCGVEE